ncbi:MAG: CPBP family intramembrane glutamic endopeptidase [Chthoniobacterales bacterium]
MALALEIALALVSGVFLFALLQRAFFPAKPAGHPSLFGQMDIAVALTLSVLFGWLAIGLFSAPEKPFTESDILGSLIMQALFGSAVLGYLAIRKIPLRDYFGLDHRSAWKSILLGFVLMLGILPCIGILANVLNTEPASEQAAVKFFRGSTSLQARVMLAFMAVVVAPVVEEMVFRGLLYRIFQGYFGKISAMFFTSVLFAAIHGNIPTLLPLTLLAFGLTAGLELTGSLLVNIAMHATFNGISLLFLLNEGAR